MDVVVGAEAEGARRATGDSGPMTTARATAPDPEVPAKVTRRRFSVEYRLRILKLADACKKPGDVGALLRREGLYSSHLTQWRQQRERGALAGMRARKRGPHAHPVGPRVKQLRSGEPSAPAQAPAGGNDHHAPKKSCRDPGDPPETARQRRARLMTAVTTVTTPGETAALCASVGVARASFYRRQRPAGPPRPRPARAAPPRALAPSERQAVLDVLHSDRFVDQSPAEVHATLLEQQTYRCSPRTMYRVLAAAGEVRGAARSGAASGVRQAGARGHGAQSDLVVGHHEAEGARGLSVLLALRDPRPVQSLRRRLDGRGPRERAARRAPDRGDMSQARHRAEAADDPCRPRRADAEHARRRAVRRPRHRHQPLAPAREQRQSVSEAQFRTVKYRPEFPDRFGSIQDARAIGPRPLRVVQQRASSQWPAVSHTRRRPLRARGADPAGPAPDAPGRLCSASRALRARPAPPRTLPEAVWINPPAKSTRQDAPGAALVTPDDPQHRVIFGSHVIVGNRRSCSSTAWSRFTKCAIRLSQSH